jgi:hypothetical protein
MGRPGQPTAAYAWTGVWHPSVRREDQRGRWQGSRGRNNGVEGDAHRTALHTIGRQPL